MGGGGFSVEPGNPALDDHVRTLAPARQPRICLLPTAGGDSQDQIRNFHATFGDQLCEPTHISLFRLGSKPGAAARPPARPGRDLRRGRLDDQPARPLARARVDQILRDAWHAGIVLAGLSDGSMCWFEYGVTKSSGRPSLARGLGLLPGSNSVRYDGEPDRRPVIWTRWRAATRPPAGESTTASACRSAARASPRSSHPGRTRARSACMRWTASPWRTRSSRGCSRHVRMPTGRVRSFRWLSQLQH
jgi:hypothetical protein